MITLYEGITATSSPATFTSMPYPLIDAIDCTVTEERNGQFSLVLRYPIGGTYWAKIIPDAIIMADPRPNADPEPFRIYEIEQTIEGVVTARANHIVYDLDGIGPLSIAAITEYWTNLDDFISSINTNWFQYLNRPFLLTNDGLTSTSSIPQGTGVMQTLWAVIGYVANAFNAELKYEWVNGVCVITFCAARGVQKPTVISYGVNLVSLDRKLYTGYLYSSVCAYYSKGIYLVSGYANTSYTARERILFVNVTDKFASVPTQEEMTAEAANYVATHDFNPLSDLSVDFVPLENTTENAGTPSVQPISDSAPYVLRNSGGSVDLGIRNRENDKLIGGTIAWNQLVQTSSASVTVPSGHKYMSRINGTNTIAISNGSAVSINDGTKDNVFDLTAMFGSAIADYVYTLESGTAGAGIAWLKSYGFFTKPYYAYDAGSLQSVKTSAHRTVGFNLLKESLGYASTTSPAFNTNNAVRVISGRVYEYCFNSITGATSWRNAIVCFDSNGVKIGNQRYDLEFVTGSGMSYNPSGNYFVSGSNGTVKSVKFTPAFDGYIIPYYLLGDTSANTPIVDPCVHLVWDGERDGEYEPYEAHTYALDDITLRGIPKKDENNNLYYDGDTYESDGTVTRKYAVRAFQSGDATDGSTMITDGTNTVYKLATPTTESSDPYINPQVVDASGTEQYVDAAYTAGTRDIEMPVGHKTKYTFVPEDHTLYLCDTATVDASLIGVSATAKCVKVVYNVLTEKYDNVTVGTVQDDIVDTIIKLGE